MSGIINLSRRDFCKAGALLGGGLVLGITLPTGREMALAATKATTFAPNAFIRIGSDDLVTIIVNKSEMGQGVYTSLPMLVAEELETDWSRVRFAPAPVDHAYDHTQWGPMQGTGGSSSVRSTWEQFRKAGATARVMLELAAAETWQVEPSRCRAKNGRVTLQGDKRSLSFGKLVEKAAQLTPPQQVTLKEPKDFTVLGKGKKRLDTPEKVKGTAEFGIDVNRPGLLIAVVARPPVFGAKLKSFDAVRAKAIPGVKAVVAVDSGVAVVADHFWPAKLGRDALSVEWDEGALASLSSAGQSQQYAELADLPGLVAAQRGEVALALAGAPKRLDAVYEFPYLAHAPMETLNCTVEVRPDACEIWVGTQMQTLDRDAAAAITGLPKEKVKLHTTYLGGGFGRRAVGTSHFVREAVQIAKEVKAPVKVIWTREDDIHGGYYRPSSYHRLSGALDQAGMPVALHHIIVGQSIVKGTPFEGLIKNGIDNTSVEGAADTPYAFPNLLVEYQMAPAGVPVLWWRSVGHSFTAMVKETFIDELAHLAGQDPYLYRRQLLAAHPRQQALLDMVTTQGSWGKPAPGHYQGLAIHESFGSMVAQLAEVSVNDQGRIRVHKVVCGVDCGRTVNPETITAQMESGIVFGLSAALHGAITFKNGRVEQNNFDDYEPLRLHEMPEVSVHIMASNEAPGGIGEPGVPPIAPAVANAVFAATGARLRTLPMTPDMVRRGMKRT
jgi:isoquinoline 1-oxidoreductase beta subunit